MKIWRIVDEKKVNVNHTCVMLRIQVLCKGGYLEEV